MYHYVKHLAFTACVLWGVSGTAVQATESPIRRHVMLLPQVEASLYKPFEQAVQHSELWQIPLPSESRQIIRLKAFSVRVDRPLYRSAVNLAPEDIKVSMTLSHEVWRGEQLLWTETLQREQQWQQPGPRALRVGQSPTQYLATMPPGAFSQLAAPAVGPFAQHSPFSPAIFKQLTHTMTQDYLQWKQQQEHDL